MTETRSADQGAPAGVALPYRLRLPGPTAVPERVLKAASRPMLAHRGPEFLDRFQAIQRRLQPILGRSGVPPFIFASTGIGAMESAMVNVAGPDARVLITTNGQWGPVFRRLAEAIGAEVDEVVSERGAPIDLDGVRKALKDKRYDAVFTVHSERRRWAPSWARPRRCSPATASAAWAGRRCGRTSGAWTSSSRPPRRP